MRIEYSTKIDIIGASIELSPADQERLHTLFNFAIEREIMATFFGGKTPPPPVEIKPVRGSLGVINLDYAAVT